MNKLSVIIVFFGLMPMRSLLYAQNVSLTLSKSAIKIGEQFDAKVSVQLGIGQTQPSIKWPDFKDTFTVNTIEVIRSTNDNTSNNANENEGLIISKTYTCTSFEEGKINIPPVTVVIDNDQLLSNSAELKVSTVPVDTTKAIKDIKDIYNESYSWQDWFYKIWLWIKTNWLALSLAFILLAGLMYWLWKKRRKEIPVPKIEIPEHIEALNRLVELKQKNYLEQQQLKLYYIELSDILRNYIERRFDIPAPELTTDELLKSLSKNQIRKQSKKTLQDILQLADLVKFAKAKPDNYESGKCFDSSVQFINETHKKQEEHQDNTTA